MQKQSFIYLALAATVGLSSCSKLGKLSEDNFTVTPNPLEVVGKNIPATISGSIPAKYMKKKAVVTVTPVLTYQQDNQKVEMMGQSTMLQGEKVMGNAQVIPYKTGGLFTLKNNFVYNEGISNSALHLKFDGYIKKRKQKIPTITIEEGLNILSTLVQRTAGESNLAWGEDGYQRLIQQKQDAVIHYLIQQANIRTSQLKTSSVQEFVKTLQQIKKEKGLELNDISIAAYASPDGGFSLNNKLAQAREKTSASYVNSQLKKLNVNADLKTRYTAQDWEGFKELVEKSNLQDKDVILRVLSMYNDPQEQEQQIRNLSSAYGELANVILPELRRARMTINYNVVGRSDQEIKDQYQADPGQLSVEELLYCAKLSNIDKEKEEIYKKTAELYKNDYRALNNLGLLAFEHGNINAAANLFTAAANIKNDAAEINANRALLALTKGDYDAAERYALKANGAGNYNELMGNIAIAKGDYRQATNYFQGINTNSAALANILDKNYNAAQTILANVANPNATTAYLKAVLAGKLKQKNQAVTFLKEAIQKDKSLLERFNKEADVFGNIIFTAPN